MKSNTPLKIKPVFVNLFVCDLLCLVVALCHLSDVYELLRHFPSIFI